MQQYGNGFKDISKLAIADIRFRIDSRQVKQIFVDETLLRVNGQNYWLWIAYEPNICMFNDGASITRDNNFLRMFPAVLPAA
jgi:transposase-like protein